MVLAFIPAVHLDGGSLALERPLRWPLRATAAVFSENLQLPISLLCFGLCAFVLGTISQEFYRGTRVRQHHTKLDFFTSLVGLVQRNTRRYGGYIIHLGVVLMFVGFAGGSYKREMEATLQKNQEAHLGPYAVRFVDLVQQETSEKRVLAADVVILKDGKEVAHAAPAKWFYPNHEEEPVTHVEIQRGAKEDLYLVLNGYESENGVINLKVVLNPLVNWIWVGFLLLAIGTAIAYLPERALVIAAQGSKVVSALRGVTGLLVFVALGLGGLGAARAQAPPRGDTRPASGHAASNVVETRERTPDEKDLFHKIVCVCDGCKRELLADCTCSYAAKDRARISGWLGEGKAKAEIMKLVGEQAWAVPPNNWVAALAAYSALLLGMGGLVLAARRLTRPLPEAGPARAAAGHTATPSTTSAPSSASPLDVVAAGIARCGRRRVSRQTRRRTIRSRLVSARVAHPAPEARPDDARHHRGRGVRLPGVPVCQRHAPRRTDGVRGGRCHRAVRDAVPAGALGDRSDGGATDRRGPHRHRAPAQGGWSARSSCCSRRSRSWPSIARCTRSPTPTTRTSPAPTGHAPCASCASSTRARSSTAFRSARSWRRGAKKRLPRLAGLPSLTRRPRRRRSTRPQSPRPAPDEAAADRHACVHCDASNERDAVFCKKCGQRIDAEARA